MYRQEIQYVNYIRDGKKEHNAGFIKYVMDKEEQRIQVHVHAGQVSPYLEGSFPVWAMQEGAMDHPVLLGKMDVKNGRGDLEARRPLGRRRGRTDVKIYLGTGQALECILEESCLAETEPEYRPKEALSEQIRLRNELAAKPRIAELTGKPAGEKSKAEKAGIGNELAMIPKIVELVDEAAEEKSEAEKAGIGNELLEKPRIAELTGKSAEEKSEAEKIGIGNELLAKPRIAGLTGKPDEEKEELIGNPEEEKRETKKPGIRKEAAAESKITDLIENPENIPTIILEMDTEAEEKAQEERATEIRQLFAEEQSKTDRTVAKEQSKTDRTDTKEMEPEQVESVMQNKKRNLQEYTMEECKWEQLWKIYPHLKPFEDQREYLSVLPGDLIILHRDCYRLVKNSFLLHGFTGYGYLIMGKMGSRKDPKYFIGVPGKYYEKECEAAVYFGFESFEGKNEPPGEGDFGYYIKRVIL